MDELKDATISELLQNVELDPKEILAQQIYTVLWKLIISIRLKPGQIISEKEISESLKASKTPVREALKKLEDTGLVRVVPNSGTFVSPISLDRYMEECFSRTQLEVGAARRAAMRNSNIKSSLVLETLLTKQANAVDEEDFDALFYLDEEMHKAIFEMAGVPGAWDLVKKSQSDVYRVRHLKVLYNLRRGIEVLDEHRAIVAAIRSGSPDDAEAAIVAHLGSLDNQIEVLSKYPELLAFIEALNKPGKHQRQKRTR